MPPHNHPLLFVVDLWACAILSDYGRQRPPQAINAAPSLMPIIIGINSLWPDYLYALPLLSAGIFSLAAFYFKPLRHLGSLPFSLIYLALGMATLVAGRLMA